MLVDTTTYRAPLTGVLGIHLDDLLAGKGSLVRQLLLKVIVRPAYADIPVLDTYAFSGAADALEVLKHEQGSARIRLYECLRHAMVHISHPTVLSIAYGFESAPCGRSLSLLEFLPESGEVRSPVLDRIAGIHRRLLAVIRHREFPDASVDPDNGGWRIDFLHLKGDRNMQEGLLVPVDHDGGCAVPAIRSIKVLLHTLGRKRYFDTSLDGIDRYTSVGEGPVAAMDKVIPIGLELNQSLAMPVALDGSVFRDDGLYDRLRHLRLETILLAKRMVQCTIDLVEVHAATVKEILGYLVARHSVETAGRKNLLSLLLSKIYLQLGCDCNLFLHVSIKQKKADRTNNPFMAMYVSIYLLVTNIRKVLINNNKRQRQFLPETEDFWVSLTQKL